MATQRSTVDVYFISHFGVETRRTAFRLQSMAQEPPVRTIQVKPTSIARDRTDLKKETQ